MKKNNIKKEAQKDAINNALYDISKNNIKSYKEISRLSFLSRIYDYYYIKTYNKIITSYKKLQ